MFFHWCWFSDGWVIKKIVDVIDLVGVGVGVGAGVGFGVVVVVGTWTLTL